MDFIKLLILTIFEVLLPFIMAAIVILWFYSCYTALKNIINFIGNVRRYNNKYITYYTANRTRIIKTSLHSIIIISLYIFIILLRKEVADSFGFNLVDSASSQIPENISV